MLRRQFVFVILTVIWMAVIFCYSAQNADESSEESNAIGMLVGRIVYSDFNAWPKEEQIAFAEKWSYPIRKTAHMTEYAILGFLLVGAMANPRRRSQSIFLMAFLVAVLYAASDEFHQYFVPGRACRLTDVGFDSAGAAVGVLVGGFFWRMKQWMKQCN